MVAVQPLPHRAPMSFANKSFANKRYRIEHSLRQDQRAKIGGADEEAGGRPAVEIPVSPTSWRR